MKIQDFQPTDEAASFLHEVDQLVEQGLSRSRSERLVTQLHDLLDGPWDDLLEPFRDYHEDQARQAESLLLQSFFIAYIRDWASQRLPNAALTQSLTLRFLANLDAKELPHG